MATFVDPGSITRVGAHSVVSLFTDIATRIVLAIGRPFGGDGRNDFFCIAFICFAIETTVRCRSWCIACSRKVTLWCLIRA